MTLAAPARVLAAVGHSLADLVLPQHCVCCQNTSVAYLCDDCQSALTQLAAEPRCHACAAPIAYNEAPCPRCRGRERRLIRTIARLGRHDGVLRELILRFKYRGDWGLASFLADQLRQQVSVHNLIDNADYLIPVPLHWRRRLKRGYNQAELLARALAAGQRAEVINPVMRSRRTAEQTRLRSITARLSNVKNSMALRAGTPDLKGKRLVLIDDVWTTGATMRTAARALAASQPARIDAIALAIADPRHRDFKTIVIG